jgi:hypothetical protein
MFITEMALSFIQLIVPLLDMSAFRGGKQSAVPGKVYYLCSHSLPAAL